MLQCIGIWFGSTTDFERLVRGPVRTTLLRELTSPFYLYRQIVVACGPVMWLFLDRVATLLVADDVITGVAVFFDALAWWIMAIPSIVLLGVALTYKLRMRQAHWVTDLLLSLAVLLAPSGMLVAVVLANFYETHVPVQFFPLVAARIVNYYIRLVRHLHTLLSSESQKPCSLSRNIEDWKGEAQFSSVWQAKAERLNVAPAGVSAFRSRLLLKELRSCGLLSFGKLQPGR